MLIAKTAQDHHADDPRQRARKQRYAKMLQTVRRVRAAVRRERKRAVSGGTKQEKTRARARSERAKALMM